MSEMSQHESDGCRVIEATARWTGPSRYKSDRLTCLEVLGMQTSMVYWMIKALPLSPLSPIYMQPVVEVTMDQFQAERERPVGLYSEQLFRDAVYRER